MRARAPAPARRTYEYARAVQQSVKDVLQTLVDDGLVQADKIGASNCAPPSPRPLLPSLTPRLTRAAVFWSFPSQRGAMVTSLTLTTPWGILCITKLSFVVFLDAE